MNKHFFLTLLLIFPFIVNAQVKVRMTHENGVYTMPCTVNGLKLKFIFDTGASSVCISLSEAYFMLKNGYLTESDINGSSYSQIANGEVVKNTTVKLREIEISGVKLFNVDAIIIHELSAPLLLGQSAIQKLGRIQISGEELILIDAHENSSNENTVSIPKSAENYYNKASNAYEEKNYNLAIEFYNKAIAIYPNYTSAYFDMGNLYDDLNNWIESARCFQRVIKIEPSNAGAYNNLGSVYESLEQYNNAIEVYQKAITLNSNFAGTYNNLGNVYLKLGKIRTALKYFQNAIDIDSGYIIAYYNLGKVNNKLGDYNEEIRCYIRAARLGHIESQELLNKRGINWK